MKVCKGCGALLQTKNREEVGYVEKLDYDYCLNCFNLKHYNKPSGQIIKTHFPKVPEKALIVYLVSALQLNLLSKYNLKRFYPTQEFILLVNKVDLLPKTINFDKWIKPLKKALALKNKPLLEVMPISALTGQYLEIFLETLDYYQKKEIYLVGFQNSGKSTLLNRIAQHLEKDEVALASHFPGLTKGNITINYNDKTIVDTPGIYEKGFISDYLFYEEFKRLIPSKTIKPKTYNLTEQQAIIVGGLVVVSLIKGGPTSFTFYLGNIKLHRTKYSQVYEKFNLHKGTLFKPIVNHDYVKTYFKLTTAEKHLINLFDLGYLVLKGVVTLEIYAPKDANITIAKGAYHGL